MLFELANASTVFQHFINDAFCEFFDKLVVRCLDIILIFSKNMKKCKVCITKTTRYLGICKIEEVCLSLIASGISQIHHIQ